MKKMIIALLAILVMATADPIEIVKLKLDRGFLSAYNTDGHHITTTTVSTSSDGKTGKIIFVGKYHFLFQDYNGWLKIMYLDYSRLNNSYNIFTNTDHGFTGMDSHYNHDEVIPEHILDRWINKVREFDAEVEQDIKRRDAQQKEYDDCTKDPACRKRREDAEAEYKKRLAELNAKAQAEQKATLAAVEKTKKEILGGWNNDLKRGYIIFNSDGMCETFRTDDKGNIEGSDKVKYEVRAVSATVYKITVGTFGVLWFHYNTSKGELLYHDKVIFRKTDKATVNANIEKAKQIKANQEQEAAAQKQLPSGFYDKPQINIPKKTEYETTEEYNKKVERIMKDSTEVAFRRFAEKVSKAVLDRGSFYLTGYNADTKTQEVIYEKGGYGDNVIKGVINDINPLDAKNLKDIHCSNGYSYGNQVYICTGSFDYLFVAGGKVIPRNYEITASDGKKFKVSLETDNIPDNSALRGSELWADNPYAKDLVITYKELIGGIMQGEKAKIAQQAAKQKETAEAKQREKVEMPIWASRIKNASNDNFLFPTIANLKKGYSFVLKMPDGDIVVSTGDIFPREKLESDKLSTSLYGLKTFTHQIHGKSVGFDMYNDAVGVMLKGNRAATVSLSMSGKVKGIDIYKDFTEAPDYFAFGVFDVVEQAPTVKAAKPKKEKTVKQTRAAEPEPAAVAAPAVQTEPTPEPIKETVPLEPTPEPAPVPVKETVRTEPTPESAKPAEQIEEPLQAVAAPQEPKPEKPAKEPKNSSGDNEFLFSIRPEFFANLDVMGIGLDAELGIIKENGLYITGELSGGAVYFGIGGNLGYCFNKDGKVKNVAGASLGFKNAFRFVDFTNDYGDVIAYSTGLNVGIGGVFHKLMIGGKHNFDITNKLLFGFKKKPNADEFGSQIWFDNGFNVGYSLSIGYTLKKSKN